MQGIESGDVVELEQEDYDDVDEDSIDFSAFLDSLEKNTNEPPEEG